jgi:hypothetical protein
MPAIITISYEWRVGENFLPDLTLILILFFFSTLHLKGERRKRR